MDRRREAADKKLKKEQEEKIKRGKAEDMTERLLREVLDEIGVHYNKTSKKADVIQKVKEARKEVKSRTEQCGRHFNFKSWHRDGKRFYGGYNDQ